MVDAHDGETVKGHVLDEVAKGLLHMLEGAVMVEMLGVDIGDDGHVGRQFQKGAVRFVGLHHHPVACAHARIGAIGVDDAAIDDGRIETARVEKRRHHRGGRGLAMGATDGDRLAKTHQLGQHLGAPHDRQETLARGGKLGIAALDRGRDDNDFRRAEIGRVMTDGDIDALFPQPGDIGILGLIGPLDRIAEIDEHFGDAAHPDAADTNEMDRPDIRRHFHRRFPFDVLRAERSIDVAGCSRLSGRHARRGTDRLRHSRPAHRTINWVFRRFAA